MMEAYPFEVGSGGTIECRPEMCLMDIQTAKVLSTPIDPFMITL
jgi:hypothetical protein